MSISADSDVSFKTYTGISVHFLSLFRTFQSFTLHSGITSNAAGHVSCVRSASCTVRTGQHLRAWDRRAICLCEPRTDRLIYSSLSAAADADCHDGWMTPAPPTIDQQAAPIKKPIEKRLYISNGSTKFLQTFALHMWVFTQHTPQILSKQLIWFTRYSGFNYQVQFFMQTYSCGWVAPQNIHGKRIKLCWTFRRRPFKRFCDVLKLRVLSG